MSKGPMTNYHSGSFQESVSPPNETHDFDLMRTSPIEDYFYYNDTPGTPMTYWAAFKIKGKIDRTALEKAFHDAIQRHPLLISRLSRHSGSRLFWKLPHNPTIPCVKWLKAQLITEGLRLKYLDLMTQPGLDIQVYVGPESSWLYFLFHHTCTDGLGALEFSFDFFWFYSSHIKKQTSDGGPEPNDEKSLGLRAQLGLGHKDWIRRILRLRYSPKSIWGYLSKTPVTIQPMIQHKKRRPPSRKPGLSMTGRLSRTDTDVILSLAKAEKVSFNSFLLAQLFIHISKWRKEKGTCLPDDILRIMIPVNQRGLHTMNMGACNMATPLFITDQAQNTGSYRHYARVIHNKIKKERKIQADLSFLLGINAYRKIPGLLAKTITANKLPTTAILSNIGNLTKDPMKKHATDLTIGEVTITDLVVILPVWPNAQVVLLVYVFGGELRLSMAYDTLAFNQKQARHFFDSYCDRLRSVACQNSDVPEE